MIRRIRSSWEKNWPEVHCAFRNGLPKFVLGRTPRLGDDEVPVFCYHAPERAGFSDDLRYLADNGYHTLNADELLQHVRGDTQAPRKSVVLTFDDGADALYQVVYPTLAEFGFRAVAFVAPYFHDHVHDLGASGRACTWDELQEMDASGVIDVQSHSYEHRYIPRWPEASPLCGVTAEPFIASPTTNRTLEQDLRLAKERLEQKLGKPVKHLGFPQYNGTSEAVETALALGYEGLWWGTLPGIPGNRVGTDPRRIVRISGEFLRRLPGLRRVSLASVLKTRYGANVRRWTGRDASAGHENG